MFRGFVATLQKELMQLRRDPATRFVFLIPVIQTIVFGFAINMDVQHIPTLVVDFDRTGESRRLLERFANTGTFDLVGEVRSPAEVRDALVAGTAKVGIVIPPDFAADRLARRPATVQVLIDGSDGTVANNAYQAASLLSMTDSFLQLRIAPASLPTDVRPRMLFNPNLESSHFYLPGLLGIILQLTTVLLTAFSIVRERERGTLEQLMVTPVSRGAIVLGKLVPYALIGMLQTVAAIGIMRAVFGVPIVGDVALLLGLSFVFLVPSLALGILISTVSHNQAEAMQLALLIMLPSVLLSGFAFPRETMPTPIWLVSFTLPVTYYVQILRGIILRGAGLAALWPQTLVLAAFGAVLMIASALRFQKRLA